MRVVTGPAQSKFAALSAKIVTMGARTVHLFDSWRKPVRLEGSVVVAPRGEGDLRPGYVRAMRTGRAVCRAK